MSKKKLIIIAEAGVNHNGNIKIAKQMIDSASLIGADFIKFQTFDPNLIATNYAPIAPYQKKILKKKINQKKLLTKLSLSHNEFVELKLYCKKKNIGFLSSAFDLKSLIFLNKIGLKIFKIPSGELTNYPYLKLVGSFNKKIYLSTGMATLSEIQFAINTLIHSGCNKKKICILHCISDYPTQFKDLNLNFIPVLKDIFKTEVGFSDHSLGTEASVAAVALGAVVIEKHFTLNKKMQGPDHKMSLDIYEFSDLIKMLKNTEMALGSRKKIITKKEKILKKFARKSIVANFKIYKGDTFSENNLTTKRPGTGKSPILWKKIIGKIAKNNYEENEKI
jgi:N,N'-diacetyllegionaminate synthase